MTTKSNNKKNLNVAIDKNLYMQIKILSFTENMKMNEIIERAIKLYISSIK